MIILKKISVIFLVILLFLSRGTQGRTTSVWCAPYNEEVCSIQNVEENNYLNADGSLLIEQSFDIGVSPNLTKGYEISIQPQDNKAFVYNVSLINFDICTLEKVCENMVAEKLDNKSNYYRFELKTLRKIEFVPNSRYAIKASWIIYDFVRTEGLLGERKTARFDISYFENTATVTERVYLPSGFDFDGYHRDYIADYDVDKKINYIEYRNNISAVPIGLIKYHDTWLKDIGTNLIFAAVGALLGWLLANYKKNIKFLEGLFSQAPKRKNGRNKRHT